jgi:hypothetical protein
MTPPLDYRDYKGKDIGVDESKGRFADVSIERCKHCGQNWLNYHYELEYISHSGRWYRGAITSEQAKRVTAAGALEMLAGLPWHLYGGSYYDTSGKRRDAPLDPDLA